ncbi:uncharacterized protein [Procambarus clarkii]|uniref:uncharacterized protein n=1 Tax=Procambarus clarkii TaxID=6728 RepID=UPI001E671176|nr:uncharacterized protein LOC123761874 [Procambarus clarkii]
MESEKCVLKNCCCGCSLRTGTIIIAVLSLLFGLATAGYSIYLVVAGVTEGWLDLVINIFNIIVAIVLIHGIRTERAGLVMAWVWATAFSIALSVVLGIVFVFITASLVAAFILFVVSAIQIYFLLVVRSYALSLKHNTLVINMDTTPRQSVV